MRNRVVQPDRVAQFPVQNPVPVVEILPAQRLVETVLVAQSINVGGRRTLPQHLQNRIARHQVNEQKHQRNHQPHDRESECEASEDLFHARLSP